MVTLSSSKGERPFDEILEPPRSGNGDVALSLAKRDRDDGRAASLRRKRPARQSGLILCRGSPFDKLRATSTFSLCDVGLISVGDRSPFDELRVTSKLD